MEERRRREEEADDYDDKNTDIATVASREPQGGIAKVFGTYRRHCHHQAQRPALLATCNDVMESYESAEALKRQAAAREPDADGFVTVSHAAGGPADVLWEEGQVGRTARPSKGRTRKRKKGAGSSERTDFYRFQTKAARRDAVQTLRQRFAEDLERIQKLKTERGGFQPFG
jgi:ribosomal RNA-processing protein 7